MLRKTRLWKQLRGFVGTAQGLFGGSNRRPYGLDPAAVKAFWLDEFNGSQLATREFEMRFRAIHATCRAEVLKVYVNGLDRNLWENDAEAADLLMGTKDEAVFRAFALEQKTNVKDGGRYTSILQSHFEARLKAAQLQRMALMDRARKLRRDEVEAAEAARAE